MQDNEEGIDFVRYCIFVRAIDNEKLQQKLQNKKLSWIEEYNRTATCVKKVRKPITDKQILRLVDKYEDLGFDDLPSWLQTQLQVRKLDVKPRPPTEIEMWETNSDAREHRILNNELTIKDFMDHYTGKRSYEYV